MPSLSHSADASRDVSDGWSEADFARRHRQKGVLNVSQQHLRDRSAEVVHLIAPQQRARCMMQVHSPQRTLEACSMSCVCQCRCGTLSRLRERRGSWSRHGSETNLVRLESHPAPDDSASLRRHALVRLDHSILYLSIIIVFVGHRCPDRILVNLTDNRQLSPAIRQ